MLNPKTAIRGLTKEEARIRLERYGYNTLRNKNTVTPLKIFLSQFNDFIVWVLIGATIISGLMGDKADAITIIIIVIMNAILGFIQEFKTEKSLEALKKLAAPTAKVIRDGIVQVINGELLVPEDIVLIESGDRVPADCVLIRDSGVLLDESLLTGESVGVEKSYKLKENKIYMGTIVLRGAGEARVAFTGMHTKMGEIADMLSDIESETSPLKDRLANLGKILVFLCLIICAIVTLMGIWRGEPIYKMFLVGVSLAVAAIPEGLAAIVTVALALGVSRMLKRNALIRKLPAVETLGCTSVICSDKTGTLTENKMTIKAVYSSGRLYEAKQSITLASEFKKAFTYCNDCKFNYKETDVEKSISGDPTETALIVYLYKDTVILNSIISSAVRVYEIPFDSDRKMMSVIIREGDKETLYSKGAPEKILSICTHILENGEIKMLNAATRDSIIKTVEQMSNKALRCIAAAYRTDKLIKNPSVEKNLIFLGIAGMMDPPRKEVKSSVEKCQLAGIKPIMITGDHKNTAFAIAKELGICHSIEQVMTGEELDSLSDREFVRALDNIRVFSRVNPSHKLKIVRGFKKKNLIVAMTGDGVNDAPAVKEADIGIAMGISGTDVTKEASSMILLDDNFSTIVVAVEEGRVIYNNIRKFIRYLLSCNLGEVLTMFLASLFYLETPLLPIQILLVNLATDGLPAIALGVDPPDMDVMEEKPRRKNESIFSRGLSEKIFIRGTLIGICTVLSFVAAKHYGLSLAYCRTIALGTLILSQLIHVFECRSEHHSIFEIKISTNMYLFGAVTVSVVMLVMVMYLPFLQGVFHTVPLNIAHWLIILFFSSIIAFINSVVLYIRRK